MPRGDRTGPVGQGSKTGRALGYCAEFEHPGYQYGRLGRRFRRGVHRTFRYRPLCRGWQDVDVTDEDRKNFLQFEIERLERTLAFLNKRLQNLDAQ